MTIKLLTTQIALLRGINVGGNHKLPMKDLARIFIDSGAANVVTYIQSGNVVFDSKPDDALKIVSLVEEAIRTKFGFPAPIILRNLQQMQSLCNSNPYISEIKPGEILYVMLLRDQPTSGQVEKLDLSKFLPDRYEVVGQDIFLRFEIGAGKTKLTNAYFDKTLSTVSTTRNWRTVSTVAEIAASRQA